MIPAPTRRNTAGRVWAVGSAVHMSGARVNQAALKNRNSLSVLACTGPRSPATNAGPPSTPANPPITGTTVSAAVTAFIAWNWLSLNSARPTLDVTITAYCRTVHLSSIFVVMEEIPAAATIGVVGDTITLTPDPMDYLRSTKPDWRQIDWPAHQHQVEIRGGPVNYVDFGQGGPACVLLHGHGGRWQYWLESLPALAERRRVIAIDLPGFGGSALPPKAARSMDNLAATVEELAGLLDLGVIDVVGHSMGTLCGIEIAAAFPARVRKLVLAAGPTISIVDFLTHPMRTGRRYPSLGRAVLADLLTAGPPMPAAVRRTFAYRPRLRAMAFAPYFTPAEKLAPDMAKHLIDCVGARGYYPVAARARRYNPRLAQRLVQCPVMLINGADDGWVPVADIEELRAATAVTLDIRISPARHLLTIEWPALFNDLVDDFLDVDHLRRPIL
jgi:pimeloyl-ACP methyl ester carboxylesterase